MLSCLHERERAQRQRGIDLCGCGFLSRRARKVLRDLDPLLSKGSESSWADNKSRYILIKRLQIDNSSTNYNNYNRWIKIQLSLLLDQEDSNPLLKRESKSLCQWLDFAMSCSYPSFFFLHIYHISHFTFHFLLYFCYLI